MLTYSAVITLYSQLEKLKQGLEELKQEHAKHSVSDSSHLARLQSDFEHQSEANKLMEVKFANSKGAMREKVMTCNILFFFIFSSLFFFCDPWPQ
jgi:hypothetical protein